MDGQGLQKKLQHAVDGMMENVERNKLRDIQRRSYLDMAKCFESRTASSDEVERCTEHAAMRLKSIQHIISNEMNQFQNRVQRCSMACEDEIQDKFPNLQPYDPSYEKAQKAMVSCASVCVDKHIAMLKSIQGTIEAELDKISR